MVHLNVLHIKRNYILLKHLGEIRSHRHKINQPLRKTEIGVRVVVHYATFNNITVISVSFIDE